MSAAAQVRRATPELVTLGLRLVAFAALAAFCLGHYAILVDPSAGAEVFRLVLVTTAAGAALAATARLPGVVGTGARLAVLAVLVTAAFAVTGLEARLVWPGNWDELRDGLDRGFAGLNAFDWPFAGEGWARLTILLAMPLLAVPAAALAFWPARRGAAFLRAGALVALLVAYGSGVTSLELSNWALRGVGLLILVAAFLWLPRVRLRRREALAALAAVGGCCVAALPFAAGLDARDPWVDYREWDWFGAPTDGTRFDWDHSYGPITWARSGIKLFEVRSDEPHYWKAESLTRFDGLRWLRLRTGVVAGTSEYEIPEPVRAGWNERLRFSIAEFESRVMIGAGTTYRVDSDRATAESSDGTVRILDAALREGDDYGTYSYVPDPSAEAMRAAPAEYPEEMLEYIGFDLPSASQSGLDPPDESVANRSSAFTEYTVAPTLANEPLSPSDTALVQQSPYGRMFRLSRRLAAGQPTTYDVVKTIERHLQREYDYSEEPPTRKYPLPAFLFRDRIGYCQQFSGAMTLMLRMNGIPARVATGFSPGSLNRVTDRYEVRDFDAHSWVEVWFAGIGWVPFDPTPSQAPASSQSSADDRAPSAARGGSGDRGGTQRTRQEDAATAGGSSGDDGGRGTAIALLGGVLLLVITLVALWLAGILRPRRHHDHSPDGAVDELRAALERLGHRYPARTTLAELERRLRVTAGDGAARYVANLRGMRFAPPGRAQAPGPRDRRELRRALTAGRGPLTRLRGLLALPPHPGRRGFRQVSRTHG